MLIYALGGVEFTVDEFLNIANVAADKMKAGDPVEKDAIARLLLLNVKIGYKKAPSYRWKEPFATLLNEQLVNSGAPMRSVVEPDSSKFEHDAQETDRIGL